MHPVINAGLMHAAAFAVRQVQAGSPALSLHAIKLMSDPTPT